MIKTIILLIIILLSTGCYDYSELNELAIITGISIDYKDDYEVTYEILSTKKSSEEESDNKSYYISGRGNSLGEAVIDTNEKLSLVPNMSHIKTIIIDEKIANEKLQETVDYIIRDPEIHNAFYLCVAEGATANEILSSSNKEEAIISEVIENMVKTGNKNYSLSNTDTFEEFISKLMDEHIDGVLNIVTKDNENIYLNGVALFEKDKLVAKINKEETGLLNILNNNSNNYLIKTKCDEENYITISLYANKGTKIKIDNEIDITSNLTGRIIEDNCNIDFKNPDNYQRISDLFIPEITTKYNDFLNKIKRYEVDPLGIQNIYYKQTRQTLSNWYTYDNKIHINLNVNKNGLVFEVKTNG